MTRDIYLDAASATPLLPAAREALVAALDSFGDPLNIHEPGRGSRRLIDDAREVVATAIHAQPDEIVFTSGATESDNLAVRGVARPLAAKGRHILTTTIEHAAVLEPCRSLERDGFEVTRVAVDAVGLVAAADVAAAMRPDTVLVSVMAANNEVGTIQPVAEIGAICRERGVPFHSDAVQAVGRIPVRAEAWGADLLSLSAHKMYGPKGVGALYVRKGRRPRLRLQPQAEGGGQERGLRSGTLNVPGIVGFGEAARLAGEALAAGEADRIRGLRDQLWAGLRKAIDGVERNGAAAPRLPGNLHVSIARAEAEVLILSLGGRIAISAGAACAEAGGKGSHVLRAMGLPDERVYTAIRFGIGRYNSGPEIEAVVEALAAAVAEARARSSAVPR